LDQAPRLVWTTLHYGAARPERLRRHAAHPELDVVGFELDEHGGLVIDAGGKELIPGRLPARSQQRPVGADDAAPVGTSFRNQLKAKPSDDTAAADRKTGCSAAVKASR